MNELTVTSQTSPSATPFVRSPRVPAPWWSVAIALVVGVAIWRGVDAVVGAALPGYSTASHAARAVGCTVLTMGAIVLYLRWSRLGWADLGWQRRGALR